MIHNVCRFTVCASTLPCKNNKLLVRVRTEILHKSTEMQT